MNFLHLSDIHFGQPSSPTHWKATIDEFLADLSYLLNDAGPIDCVLATGDIAYSGDFQQYVRATEFFERLRSFLSSQNPSVTVLPIPGNHDVARPNATDPVVQLVERDHRFVVEEIQRAIRTDSQNDYRRTMEATFRSFMEWSKSLGWRVGDWTPGILPGDAVVRLAAGPYSVGVIALNTSLLHLSGAVAEGDLSLLDEQINAVMLSEEAREPATTYILVTHHPLEWLDSQSKTLLRDGLFAALPVSLHLFGHRHESEFTMLAPGTDPRHIYQLQGRSFFGLEHLADGTTQRLHGYSVLRIERSNSGLLVQIAPRQAVQLPGGGYTFACERSHAWYVPKDSDWTEPIELRTHRQTKQISKSSRVKEAATKTKEQLISLSRVAAYDLVDFETLRQQIVDDVDVARKSYWRRVPASMTFLQNTTTVCSLAGEDVVPSVPELLYIWAIILLLHSRLEVGFEKFATLAVIEADLDWSRATVGTLSSYDRLVERSRDVSASSLVRSALDEWLLRQVLDRSTGVWQFRETRDLARRLAASLERRPSHVESLTDRLLNDAQLIIGRSVPLTKVQESWAYAYHAEHQLDHIRASLVFPLAMTLHALDFDVIRDGKEVVEQVGIVQGFEISNLHLDLDEMRWVATNTGDAQLVAECFDPAVEAAMIHYVEELRKLASYLPRSTESDILRHRVLSRLSYSIAPRRTNGMARYDRPITRLVMDSERIRSLLMGEQLYGQPRLAIRELYQNALDACRYRDLRYRYFEAIARWPRVQWKGQIAFFAGYDESGVVERLECRDNGIGMSRDTLRDCFLTAGTRFTETASFAEEQAEWLRVDESLRLVPNSTFGIGVYSYFMLADVVDIVTRPESADGILGQSLRLQMNAGSSVARLSEYLEGDSELPTGGTIVRLHLRPEFRSVSKLQLGNFVDEVILRSPFEITIVEGNERHVRAAGEISSEIPSPHHVAWRAGESSAWWRVGSGPLLADGIKTPERVVGLMVNLHGAKKPVLRVDRNAVVKWDLDWVLEQTAKSAQALAEWQGLSLAWLWSFCERYPVHGRQLFESLLQYRRDVPLGQSRLWGRSVDLALVGCFPGDRYLLTELYDSRWRTEYPEIEIPKISRKTDPWYHNTVRFPSCLRPWRRRLWMEALPDLFEGWDPDARNLTRSQIETVSIEKDLSFPVWEPLRTSGLRNPDAIDAALIASQPDIMNVSLDLLDAGHTTLVDIVAFVHGTTKCNIGLGEALTRISQFIRFGLRGLPNLKQSGFDYVPTKRDCQLVASLGRAWSAFRHVQQPDFLQLLPLCQEEGISVGEAVDGLEDLLDRLGVASEKPRPSETWVNYVPSSREVRFFGFGEYDRGRELRYGRGTRAALIRGAYRADMQTPEVARLVRRYRSFGMGKYEKALRALRLNPKDSEMLRAWSANFDSRAPWVDEEVFRRGFIGDQPSSKEELLGHAVFYSVLAEVSLHEAARRVFSFPGLSVEQRMDTTLVPDVPADERDLELLKSRIGETSSYQDKRFAGIGQQQLVRRRWSVLELQAAAKGTHMDMSEVFQRLSKFRFLGVELPDCQVEEIEGFDFNELDMTILTTEDRSLGAFDRFSHFDRHDKKPIIGPIPAVHLMRVAADEKVSLGTVMTALARLEHLGVESGAQPLPDELAEYVPSREEASLAGHLKGLPLGYGIVETAFQGRLSLAEICNRIQPWCAWMLDAERTLKADKALQLIRNGCGSVSPSYSDVSFYAAAHAQAKRNGNMLDGTVLVALSAQANVTLGESYASAKLLSDVFYADGIHLGLGDTLGAAESEHPDSRWVVAVVPETVVGGHWWAIRSLLGIDKTFVKTVAGLISGVIAHVSPQKRKLINLETNLRMDDEPA